MLGTTFAPTRTSPRRRWPIRACTRAARSLARVWSPAADSWRNHGPNTATDEELAKETRTSLPENPLLGPSYRHVTDLGCNSKGPTFATSIWACTATAKAVRRTRRSVRRASPTTPRPQPPDPNGDRGAHAPGSASPLRNATAHPSLAPRTTTSHGATPRAWVLDAGPYLQQAHPAGSLMGLPSDSIDEQHRQSHSCFHATPSP